MDTRLSKLPGRVLASATALTVALGVAGANAASKPGRAVSHERVMQSGQKMFDRLDTNKDGVVDAAEYAVYVEQEIAKLRARLQQRFADDNLAKDGRLTAAEFMAGREKWFQGLDTNHDGTIDEAEFAAGRKGPRAQGPAAMPAQ